MATAKILDTDMSAWPPKTYHVELGEPLNRFDPETGVPEPFSYIALTLLENNTEAYIFPSNEIGGFVDLTMTPMRRRPNSAFPHPILNDLGYDVE